jgi:ADP-ribose pyrophosphatase YjhB (NUDIX family)
VAFRGDRLLLIQRGKEPRKGEWTLPGGAVELGETVREAAVREFREEIGGEVELGEVVDAVDIVLRDDAGAIKYHYVVVDFRGEWPEGEMELEDEVMAARWVTEGDLDGFKLAPWTRVVVDKAIALRAAAR